MNRPHLPLSVDNPGQNIRCSSSLFGTVPGGSKDDHARRDLAEPAVNFAISRRAARTGLAHVGIQADSAGEPDTVQARLQAAGISGVEQRGTVCCDARSDKYRTREPRGIARAAFPTLDSSPTSNAQAEAAPAGDCCVPAVPGSSCC